MSRVACLDLEFGWLFCSFFAFYIWCFTSIWIYVLYNSYLQCFSIMSLLSCICFSGLIVFHNYCGCILLLFNSLRYAPLNVYLFVSLHGFLSSIFSFSNLYFIFNDPGFPGGLHRLHAFLSFWKLLM